MNRILKKLKKAACLFLSLAAVLSAMPADAVAPPVAAAAADSAYNGLSPYKDIVDSASLGTLTEKSMLYKKPLTGIQKILQSDKYLRLPGPLHAEKAGLTGVTYTYSDKVRVLEPDTLAPLNDENEANDQPALNLMLNGFLERKEEIASGSILVDEKARQALRVTAPPDAEPGTYLYDSPALHEIFDSFEIPEQTVYLKEGNISRTAVAVSDRAGLGLHGQFHAGKGHQAACAKHSAVLLHPAAARKPHPRIPDDRGKRPSVRRRLRRGGPRRPGAADERRR